MFSASSGPVPPAARVGRREDRRQDREVLGDVVGDRERRQRAARDQQLLADLDDLDELRRVGVEVDHVARPRGRPGCRCSSPRRRRPGRAPAHRWCRRRSSRRAAPRPAPRGSARACASGVASASKSSTPASSAILAAVSGLSPVTMTVRMPIAQLVEALAHPLLDDVLQLDHAEHLRVARTASGVPPSRAMRSTRPRARAAPDRPRRRSSEDRVARALAQARAVHVDAAHAGLGGERDELASCGPNSCSRMPYCLASTTIERPSGVSSASEASCAASASSLSRDARHRDELRRLPVAERDRAGLVEQQHVDVAGRLDRPARQREHVAADEPVHAGDADRATAARRSSSGSAPRAARSASPSRPRVGEVGERAQRDDDEQEDQRQRGEQDAERDLVRRLARLPPSTSPIIRSRNTARAPA